MEKQLIKNSSADKEEKIFLSSVYDKLKTASEKGYAQAGDFCTESEQERIRSLVFCDITEADFVSKIKNAQRKMLRLSISNAKKDQSIYKKIQWIMSQNR